MSRDLKWCTPDDDDFKFISEAYVDWQLNGDKAAPKHLPENLADDAEFKYGDMGTAVKWMIIAAFLGWKELFELLKEVCPNVGWATGEVGQTIQELKKQSSALLTSLYNKYCGPDCSHTQNTCCGESLQEDVLDDELIETIEKHEELNPALFDNSGKLKSAVKDKINEIVDEFLKDFVEVGVELIVQDIILTGSNASYNYTKDSDLDIHIIADTSKISDTLNLHKVIYNAYKSAFNRRFEIELNKVPVEVYVETQDTPLVSNGIYSVVKDEWVKEPTKEDIPEVDQEAIDKAFKPWEEKYRALVNKIDGSTTNEADIDTFINDLYDLRQKGLSTDGEYSIENLIFKEMRNNGYLDNLKELRHKVIARRLSLQEKLGSLSDYLSFLDKLN